MVPNWVLEHLQAYLVWPFFDQLPNKCVALLVAGQFATRLQEFGLRDSLFDGSWQAMPFITTFLNVNTLFSIFDPSNKKSADVIYEWSLRKVVIKGMACQLPSS